MLTNQKVILNNTPKSTILLGNRKIKWEKIGSRSAHFCPRCQRL
ncbi:MAG: hypothetical protein DRP35_04785 [Candidatus Zixiibacteriota bacterium]|nr:MAG: hypothetical protein DRP35_04785 [candidate division Zixibacteria bacterium]